LTEFDEQTAYHQVEKALDVRIVVGGLKRYVAREVFNVLTGRTLVGVGDLVAA
jgi:hypothetical protein